MIIPATENAPKQTIPSCAKHLPRKERRQLFLNIKRRVKNLEKQFKHISLDFEFTNKTTTSFGNFHFLEKFKQSIDLKSIIKNHLTLKKGKNSQYSSEATLDYLIDSCCLGFSRFDHTESLRNDPGYKDVKQIDQFPSEKVFRDYLSLFSYSHIQELCQINQELIKLHSQWEGAKEVWFDIDSTIITIFGFQQGGKVRYNPRYKGRRSFELTACFINETKDLLYVELCEPGQTPKTQLKDFLARCQELLPHNYVLKGVRLDKGFFSENNIEYLENNYLEYVAKVPLYGNIRSYLEATPENEWSDLNNWESVTRKRLLLDSWQHDRYIDIRRSKMDKKSGQLKFAGKGFYTYEVILSSQIEKHPEDNFSWYDHHAIVEDHIKEIKYGFNADQMSQHDLFKNNAFAFVKVIAYNLVNFFKRVALPNAQACWQVQTLRRKLFNISGNILGLNRYRRVKLAANKFLEYLLPQIKRRLADFLWFVAYDFQFFEPELSG